MARSEEQEARTLTAAGEEPAVVAPRRIRNSKLEEGEAKGDGWVAIRSLLLVVGGMILVSYLIFSL